MDFGNIFENAILIAGALGGYELVKIAINNLFKNKNNKNGYLTKLEYEKDKKNLVDYGDYKEDKNTIDKRLNDIWKQVDYLVRLEIEEGKR